ncbi:MAG: peptidoglycan recognition family protein [Hyphomicrobiaceae bacterium]
MPSLPADTQASTRGDNEALARRTDAPPAVEAETFACEAAGDPRPACHTAAPRKPRVDRGESTGHKSSRGGRAIDHIVIHYTTSRNIEGSISHFKTGTPRASAHYIVGQDGKLVQMVADRDCAWHAGTSNMNLCSIGIEHVARVGDRITEAQARTSIALIRWLMHAYAIPAAHVIPHVCVKSTSCCGDLFKDFGGGAGLSCATQKAALHKWLAANGVGENGPQVASAPAEPGAASQTGETGGEPPRHWIAPLAERTPSSSRLAMARVILDFEARRDAQGRIAVYRLPAGDGGGRYEVAGINERYHPAVCDELVALIRAGRHAEAEERTAEHIAQYTDKAAAWTHNAGVELFLRDCMFNRGPGGAAWILQKAVGVATDRDVGPITLAAAQAAEAAPEQLLDRLRRSREAYERLRRDETSRFWTGLVNRWNKAHATALEFMSAPAVPERREMPEELPSGAA